MTRLLPYTSFKGVEPVVLTHRKPSRIATSARWQSHLFQNIHVPILGIIGDQDESEYTIIPSKDAVELLETENRRAEVYQIENSNHAHS